MNNRHSGQSLELELLPSYGLLALVVKHRSFSEAARISGLARSAVSQRIARLEQRHGAQLLRRTTRRVTATDAGIALYEQCTRLLDDAEGLSRLVNADRLVGPLRVNAPLSLVSACLRRLLLELLEKNPGLTIDLNVENKQVDLLEARDEVVVRMARSLSPDIVARKLTTARMVLVGSQNYFATKGRPQHPSELVHHQCLRYGVTPATDEWRFEGNPLGLPVTGPFVVNDGGVLKDLVLEHQGLAILPEHLVSSEVKAGQLEVLLERYLKTTLTCWAVLPAGRNASKRARLLVDFLGKHLPAAYPRIAESRAR